MSFMVQAVSDTAVLAKVKGSNNHLGGREMMSRWPQARTSLLQTT